MVPLIWLDTIVVCSLSDMVKTRFEPQSYCPFRLAYADIDTRPNKRSETVQYQVTDAVNVE